uniref:CCR4-NOT transcription complex subunit 4 n=1 Tax=Noccaea caerulescens TaxID=107243 RepID=A0A1J3EUS8_NOCCA
MNDKGEKTCPICAEEMDLTDQHLNPCKCGYQICVWCWHQIIEMAEKDKTEGRCPACRTPYDKEKIVGMTVSCESLVAELNNDRKKSQKVKPKHSEGRKDLTGVRVIQRNLVYVVSLPLELADEDLFQRREYFGQYGKVVKVAMSRTPAGAVQQFPNNTCRVYITYSKEEEAIRCIQAVHGFILDGRSLKACFGTMKYCHAWLRNMPCTNAECLYLHEIGSQEDSFTKDETISVHMGEIIQQITGSVVNFPRRSGNMLPPPVDDYVDNNESSTRKIPKCAVNNAPTVFKISPPNSSNGRSVTLPAGAMWGMHSSSQSSVASAGATNPAQISASHFDVVKKPALEDDHTAYGDALKPQELLDDETDFPELSASNRTQISNSRALMSSSVDNSRAVCADFPEHTSQSCGTMLSNGNNKIAQICSDAVSGDADNVVDGYRGVTRSDGSHCDHPSIKSSHTEVSRDSLQRSVHDTREFQPLQKCGRTNSNEVVVSREEANGVSALISPLVTDRYLEAEDDISLFNRQRLKDPEVLSCQPNMASNTGLLRASNDETRNVFGSSSSDSRASNVAPVSHGYSEMPFSEPSRLNGSLNHSVSFPDKARDTQPIGNRCIDSERNSTSEMDDRMIANILSLDLDEYLTSPNLSKLLGPGEVEAGSLKLASSGEVKNNQSRFSFARQEESNDRSFESRNVFNQISHGSDFYQNSSERQNPDMNMLGRYNGLSSSYVTQNSTLPSSYKPPSVPRYPVSAPPGFSVAARPPPPPGFASNGLREQQTFNGFSGNHRFSDSTMFSNPYQSLPIENNGGVRDVQFMDPAILAVGQAQGFDNGSLNFRSNFQGNTNMFGNEAKLQQQQQQMAMQSPLSSSHQNCRFTGLNGSLGMAPRLIDQQTQGSGGNLLSRNLALPNGHWDGLSNEIQSRNRLQSERLYASSNRMNGYNGTFRI